MGKTTSKKIISLTVMLLLVLSLSVGAAADIYSVKVTVRSGDTLSALCKANGVELWKCKDVVMRLNGFTDEKQLDRIKVGDTVEIPASSADAARMSQAANIKVYSENGAIPVQHNPMTNIVAGDVSKVIPGDQPAYYIVSYTLEYGDNLTDLYRAWGMDVTKYVDIIKMLNSLSDLNYLPVDKTLYLPSTNAAFGTVKYTVMEHVIADGDTAYMICQKYGLNYDAAQYTLQSFNPNMNLTKIIVNQKMYIPVAGMATAASVQTANAAAADQYAAYLAYVAQQQAAQQQAAQQQAAQQQQQQILQPAFPAITGSEYTGFGVVISYGSLLTVRLENYGDIELNVTPAALGGYYPRPGDYVKLTYSTADKLLESMQYVYNVFAGA